MALDDPHREAIKRDMREQLGIEVNDREIADALQKVETAKAIEQRIGELREHLARHHYTMTGLHLFGEETLQEIHKTAQQQGSHPAE